MVESLQREVEQLEEKLAELGGKVREGRAGASRVSGFKQHSTVHAALWHSDVWLSYGPESRRWNL